MQNLQHVYPNLSRVTELKSLDAFESLISMLLRHQGYWTTPSFKVELTKDEKVQIGRPSSPRWELDLVAYKASTNSVLAIECKSLLDSRGVTFCDGVFLPNKRYKLFSDETLRSVVLNRLMLQLQESGACRKSPKVQLCLAVGKIAKKTDVSELKRHFEANGWRFLDSDWVGEQLFEASHKGYENDVAFIVSKLLVRNKELMKKLYGD